MSASLPGIAVQLAQQALASPDQLALVVMRGSRIAQQMSFSELSRGAQGFVRAFQRRGIREGMRVLVLIKPGTSFVCSIFALLGMGAIPLLIDPGMGLARFLRCIRQVKPQAMVGTSLAIMIRRLYAFSFRSVQITHRVRADFNWRTRPAEFTEALNPENVPSDQIAAILFTSGSTGPAKGVAYEHGMFAAQVRAIRDQYQIAPGEIELATFPLFALFCPALGMTCVFPDMNFSKPGHVNPARIIEAIRECRPTSSFGSPALWWRMVRYCRKHDLKLEHLRRILIAGAPVPWQLIESLREMLDEREASIHTPYGATEALPVASNDDTTILRETADATREGKGICVGNPNPHAQVRILRISDTPIPEWTADLDLSNQEVGEITVTGPYVTRTYWELQRHTVGAKVEIEGQIWHRMGDLGYFDQRGRLWFCGRKAHRVETRQGRLYSVCCEAIFNRHPEVARSALVGVGVLGAQKPVIIIECNRRLSKAPRQEVVREILKLAQSSAMTQSIQTALVHPKFPVDARHNAKIDREQLARWAAEKLK